MFFDLLERLNQSISYHTLSELSVWLIVIDDIAFRFFATHLGIVWGIYDKRNYHDRNKNAIILTKKLFLLKMHCGCLVVVTLM